jgi:hypothetical protein
MRTKSFTELPIVKSSARQVLCTVVADNGTEFCGHELVAEKLKPNVYFANPSPRNCLGCKQPEVVFNNLRGAV